MLLVTKAKLKNCPSNIEVQADKGEKVQRFIGLHRLRYIITSEKKYTLKMLKVIKQLIYIFSQRVEKYFIF